MGKYDHINELTGAENYFQWCRQMMLALQGECLWSHCSDGTDQRDLSNLASSIPTPVNSSTITNAKRESILDWLAKDAQAKALIDRKISTTVAALLDVTHTAHEQWETLSSHYSCTDLLSQYQLRTRVCSEKLKDADDVTRYIGIFEDARQHFIQMGITYTTEESIFDLLQGLPQGVEWDIFRELTMNKLTMSLTTPASTTSPPLVFTFNDATKLLSKKANSIVGRRNLAGPSSEYANVAIGKVNPSTAIRIHKNNPQGIRCTNPACAGKTRADTHDWDHCYWPGGGMEDTAPTWLHNRSKKPNKEEKATVVITEQTPVVPPPLPMLRRELSCVVKPMIDNEKEFTFLSGYRSATILDSSTTSHLIKDRGYFIDIEDED